MTRPMTFPDPPLNMNQAATALGVSRRFLTDSLKSLPYFDQRGTKKVFYPEHIEALRRGLNQCASKSSGERDGRTSPAPAPMAHGSDALSRLATLVAQRKPARR